MGELIVLRHGETEWSRTGRHTGRTDVALSAHGEDEARGLSPPLRRRGVVRTFVSPAKRAGLTARLAGLRGAEVDADLWEWDYGAYEGRTTEQIRQGRPDWYLWRDGVPPGDDDHPGESVEQVGARVDAVLERVRPFLNEEDVAIVAHGHVLRVLTARWLGLPPDAGRFFRLGTGTMSFLGAEHDRPVIDAWNVPPSG